MKSYKVEVRELIDELAKDREGNVVERKQQIKPRLDLGFRLEADVPSSAIRKARELFAKGEFGKVLFVRSCTSGPNKTINLVVGRRRPQMIPPRGWVWKKPPATPEP